MSRVVAGGGFRHIRTSPMRSDKEHHARFHAKLESRLVQHAEPIVAPLASSVPVKAPRGVYHWLISAARHGRLRGLALGGQATVAQRHAWDLPRITTCSEELGPIDAITRCIIEIDLDTRNEARCFRQLSATTIHCPRRLVFGAEQRSLRPAAQFGERPSFQSTPYYSLLGLALRIAMTPPVPGLAYIGCSPPPHCKLTPLAPDRAWTSKSGPTALDRQR